MCTESERLFLWRGALDVIRAWLIAGEEFLGRHWAKVIAIQQLMASLIRVITQGQERTTVPHAYRHGYLVQELQVSSSLFLSNHMNKDSPCLFSNQSIATSRLHPSPQTASLILSRPTHTYLTLDTLGTYLQSIGLIPTNTYLPRRATFLPPLQLDCNPIHPQPAHNLLTPRLTDQL